MKTFKKKKKHTNDLHPNLHFITSVKSIRHHTTLEIKHLAGKFVLKQSSDLEFTIAEGKEFHSHMDLRKKENFYISRHGSYVSLSRYSVQEANVWLILLF